MKSQPVGERPRYRKKGAYFYTHVKIASLPAYGKLTADYLLNGQVNRVGLFLFSIGRAQEELSLTPKVFNANFELVLDTMAWKFDRAARVLYIPTWWRYNAPENPNVLLGALDDLNGLPVTPFLNEFAANVRYLPHNLHETFTQRMRERYGERLAIQVAGSREQVTENRREPPSCPPLGGRSVARVHGEKVSESKSEESVPYEVLIRMWNDLPCVNQFEGEPGKATRRRIRKLWLEHPELSWWADYFGRIAGTPELKGYLDSGWCASLTWALQQSNVEKVLSGHYGAARG